MAIRALTLRVDGRAMEKLTGKEPLPGRLCQWLPVRMETHVSIGFFSIQEIYE